MTLPRIPLPADTVVVADEKIEVHALTRAEAVRMRQFGDDYDAAETYVLARGTDVDDTEAQAWREQVPFDLAGLVVDRILELSGLNEEASKSGDAGSP